MFGGGWPIGRLHSYRSLLPSSVAGGDGNGGGASLRGSLGCHPPPCPPPMAPRGMYGAGIYSLGISDLSRRMLAGRVGIGAIGRVPRLIGIIRGWCCWEIYLYRYVSDFVLHRCKPLFGCGDAVLVVVGPGLYVPLEYSQVSVVGDIGL